MPREPDTLHFVVMDGDSPGDWRPWTRTFSELKELVDSDDLMLVAAERQHPHFEIRVLLHSPELLRTRDQKNVSRIVGVIIDGITYLKDPQRAEAIRNDFEILCNKLGGAGPSGWMRRVGFYVLVAIDGPLDPAFAQCRFELERAANFAFGPDVHCSLQPIIGDNYLQSAIQAIEVGMMASHKRWMAQSQYRTV
jgi:hypothetical protein